MSDILQTARWGLTCSIVLDRASCHVLHSLRKLQTALSHFGLSQSVETDPCLCNTKKGCYRSFTFEPKNIKNVSFFKKCYNGFWIMDHWIPLNDKKWNNLNWSYVKMAEIRYVVMASQRQNNDLIKPELTYRTICTRWPFC